MKELELYVHIPFCVRKCSYCDFLSFSAEESIRQNYVEQLLLEIRATAESYSEYEVTSIFVGGGTPSCLPPVQMKKILRQLQRCFHIDVQAEVTVECNPGTLDLEKLQSYLCCGVNRLSLGLQSVHEKELRLLGRIHTFPQFLDNYELARRLGYQNINVDLMSALPGQKLQDYEETLQRIAALEPEHISAYSLIIEPGTPFYEAYGGAEDRRRRDLPQELLPSEDEERGMYERTKEILQSHGYLRYEISNYAKPGYECRHNNGYWTRKNYLGFGIGAASLVENERFSNISDLKSYLSLDFEKERPDSRNRNCLEIQEQMEEFMFLGLRRMAGISNQEFFLNFGVSLQEVYGLVLQKQQKMGLVRRTAEGYCLTDYGIDLSNQVFSEFLFDTP